MKAMIINDSINKLVIINDRITLQPGHTWSCDTPHQFLSKTDLIIEEEFIPVPESEYNEENDDGDI